jgi:SAM-dependent methyltransferase
MSAPDPRSPQQSEPGAVRERYARRTAPPDRYAITDPAVYMTVQEKERALIRWLTQWSGFPIPAQVRLLEVGCGAGANLSQMLKLGLAPGNLVGNELIEERLAAARRQLPEAVRLVGGDASVLDFEAQAFDVVLQSTVFTSLLDGRFQERLAARMWDWVRPGGGVLWYDFVYDNPRNPDVRGVPLRRIRELFPQGEITWRRVTLAPPIARRVTRLHPALYDAFNVVPWLRSHVLCWIARCP